MLFRKDTLASRRMALKAGLAAAIGSAAVVGAASGALAQEKIAQNLVQYQDQPKDGAQCNKCVNWQPPNACTIVSGAIKPEGWCVAFAPKES